MPAGVNAPDGSPRRRDAKGRHRPVPMHKDRKTARTTAAEPALQIVTFQVGAEEYGVAIAAISEIIRPLAVTALPRMPQFVEGVINLRGMIIPIVDLRKRFGMAAVRERARAQRMLIVRGAAPGLLGMVVDGVREVLLVPRSQIEPPPQAATAPGVEFLAGVAKAGDRLIILLDISTILSREERASLAEADDVHP